jgi:hypothetical protein
MRTSFLWVLALGVVAPTALSVLLVHATVRPPLAPDVVAPLALAAAVVDEPDRASPAVAGREPIAPDEPPVSLTASDGSGLRLAELRASAVIEGPLAFTEVHFAFDNAEDRVREGTFHVVLPRGASLGRFAMKIGDAWQEGEVVAKEHARRAYEDALHRKQDPALLETGAANDFTARVFPIPPRARKEIIVSYAQELTGGAPYALPLRGLPEVGVLDVRVSEGGAATASLHREHEAPAHDFVAETRSGAPHDAVRAGELVVARVRPVAEAMPDPVKRAVVLVDTSASRALGLASELRAVQATLAAIAAREEGAWVSVAAFDQAVTPVFQGEARAFGDAEVARVLARRALGASNVERALAWARDEVGRTGAPRVILVTDAVATAGEDDAAKLGEVASSLRGAGCERLDVIAVGGLRDDALAHRLVTAGLARDGVVVSPDEGSEAIARRLEAGTRSNLAVAVDGATWVYPTRIDGVQPGDEVMVYAEVPRAAPSEALAVRIAGRATPVDAVPADRPLVERAWARAKIASLEDEERTAGKSPELERAIVDLSTQHRVLSAHTALLVLETDADYARFHIDRRALADVLTIDRGRLALAKRTDIVRGQGTTKGDVARDDVPTLKAPVPGGDDDKAPAMEKTISLDEVAITGALGAGDGLAGIGQGGGGAGMGFSSVSAAPVEAAPTMAPPPSPARAAPAPALRDVAENHEGGTGTRARGEEGSMGNPSTTSTGNRYAVAGPAEDRGVAPYTGPFQRVKDRLAHHDASKALAIATSWQASQPGDVLALVALGEASEAAGDPDTARRAYGSLIDLFPSRADLRRFAGERLEHVAGDEALDLAIDTFDKARRDRPDHPASHRLAAFARVRKGDYAGAFDVAVAGLAQRYPEGRFRGVDRILREDLGLIAAAWMHAEPAKRSDVLARLRAAGGEIEDRPSIRFVLNWETDANDVDFHIEDAQGGHAYYGAPVLPSGGELYADVTTGYGPECFTIRAPRGHRAGPYKLRAHYFSRGPMGYGMGKLEIIDHDGRGGLTFEEREFVVMADHAFVDLGTIRD